MNLGPVEGWLLKGPGLVGFVKGCFHPLPGLFYVPRVLDGRKIWLRETGSYGVRNRCFDFSAPVARPGEEYTLVSPIEAAAALRRGCGSRVCQAALLLLEELGSAAGFDRVGVTGGLAYSPLDASDADVVVYGFRAATEAYRRLLELREEGVTEPYYGSGHGWVEADSLLHRALAAKRVLFGALNGVEYNVRLVACERPSPCSRVLSFGSAAVRARICSGVGFTTPTLYRLCGSSIAQLLMSHRLRYTEIPIGAAIEAKGRIEEVCGMRVLVPDHGGYVRIMDTGAEGK